MPSAPLPPQNLSELADRLKQTPVADELTLEGFQHQLLGLRNRMGTQSEELLGCVDAASSLMRSLAHLADPRAEEVRSMVVRLLNMLHDECSPGGIPSQVANAPEVPAVVSPAGLRTINDMALGEVMVQLGVITPDQIDLGLRHMTHTKKQFGETLVEMGFCTWEAVEQGLNLQRALSCTATEKDPESDVGPIQSILLGEMLIGMGKITRGQLDQGLAFQRKMRVRIGAALVALGIITWPDVSEAVKAQENHRFPKRPAS